MLTILALTATPTAVRAQATETTFDSAIDAARKEVVTDPSEGRTAVQRAGALISTLPADERRIAEAKVAWLTGEANLRLNDLDRAKAAIDRGLRLVAGDPPSKLLGDLLIARGSYHMAVAEVAATLDDYQRAHNIFHAVGETRSQAMALVDIGVLYQEAKDYPNALKYFSQALDVYRGDPMLLYTVYNNRGDALKEMGRYTESEADLARALKIARDLQSGELASLVLRNVARTQLLAGELAAADRTIAEGFRETKSSARDESASMLWAMAAQAALQHGRLPQAKAMIARSFAGIDLATTPVQFRANHQTAYDIYSRTGDAALALAHLAALKRLDDETLKLAASINTALAGARFDYANQELRITKLKADDLQQTVAFERARARTQIFVFFGVAGVTIVILLMLAFGLITIRRSRNQVRAANVGLGESNAALGKALAAKTEFLATTSHEIRTPLNGILGMTQVMLADRALAPEVRDRISVVHGAGVTMRALVDDILDVAKMESGKLTIEQVPFDLVATLTDASRLWQEQAKTRGLGFELVVGEAGWIAGDPARVRQVVFNLLSNAMKFTETGTVRLAVDRGDGQLRVVVSDTGIGIPPEKLELIFESFRQADAGTTRRFGGTGLGLAICRNLARAMGGDILVESGAEGSSFTLDLPDRPASAPKAEPEAGEGGAVIVDRNPISRSLLKAVLEPRAGRVRFADDLAAAAALSYTATSLLLIDETALRDEQSIAALAGLRAAAAQSGARLVLLWKGEAPPPGADLVIVKPIAGAALADRLFPTDSSDPVHLATRAA